MPNIVASAGQQFNETYRQCSALSVPETERKDVLRVSSFPYCALRHLHTRLTQPEDREGFGKSFFTGVGTSVHSSVQKFVGLSGQLYGDWKCLKCDGSRQFSANHLCPKCSAIMEYVELELRLAHVYEQIPTCHLDGVYKTKERLYYVVDYKTTNCKTIEADDGSLPYATNVAQIESYCALFELQYAVKISGWILHYIARDNPKVCKTVSVDVSAKRKREILADIRHYNYTNRLVMGCRNWSTVKEIINAKPCKSYEHYRDTQKKFEACPLQAVCFNEKLLLRNMQGLWEDRPANFLKWKT